MYPKYNHHGYQMPEQRKRKYPLWCCQTCGENIGFLGHFVEFMWGHKMHDQDCDRIAKERKRANAD